MLAIEVTFLTGRYVATTYNDRRRSEWPPHPARFFSALAATHFAEEAPLPDEREILAWIEGLGAPQLTASEASERDVVTVYVPVNDDFVVKDFSQDQGRRDELRDEIAALDRALGSSTIAAAARREHERDKKRKAGELKKLETKLAQAIAKETAEPDKISKSGPKDALRVLPDHRNRQPRTFPSCTPVVPAVTFTWPDANPTDFQRAVLDRLLSRLVRLGHSSSLVSARVLDVAPAPDWIPAEYGERLRVARRGQLLALEGQFSLHCETEPRVMPAHMQPYDRRRAKAPDPTPSSLFSSDWLVLRRVGGPVLPISATPSVARAVRRTLMSFFGEDAIPEVLSGHRHDRAASESDHLAIVPLAFVGHPHADGAILGVALVLPRVVAVMDRRAIYRAVAQWEDRARIEHYNADLAADEIPELPLHLGSVGTLRLERIAGAPKQASLRSDTWCHPAIFWSTATPIALDRNPGDLRSRDPVKLEKALSEARATIRAGCVRIGLPAPTEVEILPAAPWVGSQKARDYRGFKAGDMQRVLVHARVRFAVPVAGPLLIGAGRYHGLGLLRPEYGA